jgi:putative iron-dependent peroxidase
MFVSFGASFDAFEAQMRRMAGIDDGVIDALFRFTQPLTGAYYWCPPLKRGKVDFSKLL